MVPNIPDLTFLLHLPYNRTAINRDVSLLLVKSQCFNILFFASRRKGFQRNLLIVSCKLLYYKGLQISLRV